MEVSSDPPDRLPTYPIPWTLAAMFVVLAVGLAVTGPAPTTEQWIAASLLLPLFVLAQRTVFVHGISVSVPTQAVFVGLLLLFPPQTVPALLLVAVAVEARPQARDANLWAAHLGSCWFSLGPVLVLVISGVGPLGGDTWGIYLLALLAQFVIDLLYATTTELGYGRSARAVLRPLLWNQAVDVSLSVIGASAVLATGGSLWSVLLLAAPVLLIALLIQDRQVLASDHKTLGLEVSTVRNEARIDPLTGLGNRRAWQENLDALERRLEDGSLGQAGVIVADLNDLKLTNDGFGHDAGDELLRTVGRLFAASTPDGSSSARFGGDEFGMLLTDAGPQQVQEVVQRLNAMLAAHPGVHGLPISAAIGGSSVPPAPSLAAAVQLADGAAMAAKERHRRGRSGDPRLPAPRVPLVRPVTLDKVSPTAD